MIASWRRAGRRAACRTLLIGGVWLASFGPHYALTLRHTLGNPYLQNYWGFAFPPASTGMHGTLLWLLDQLQSFAVKPVGSGLWGWFWLASAAGMVFALLIRPAFGVLMATVPLSAVALAVLRLVPPFERLALWVVPTLYVSVGLSADASMWLARRRYSRGRLVGLALALAAGIAAARVTFDIFQRGKGEFFARPRSNYGLDDRSSVRLAMRMLRPGDVLMTTHFGLAAVWWYSGLNISGPDGGSRLQDGTPIFEIGHAPPGPECDGWKDKMRAALGSHSRAVVYLGFRLNVLPEGFDTLVLQEFNRRYGLVTYRQYAEGSRLAVFELGRAPLGRIILPLARGAEAGEFLPEPAGCITTRPAHRW